MTAFAFQPDGKIVIGGIFSAINGVGRTNLARLNPNGSLDLTWNPAIDGSVTLLLIDGNNLFLAGPFRSLGGLERNGLAKANLDDGQVDPNWNPNPVGQDFPYAGNPTEAPPDFRLISAMVSLGGNIFVAGDFVSIGGQNRTNLAKIEIEGAGRVDVRYRFEGLPARLSRPHDRPSRSVWARTSRRDRGSRSRCSRL